MKFRKFELIADYPSCPLKVGEEVECNKLFDKKHIKGYENHLWNGKYYGTFGRGRNAHHWLPGQFAKYPHLFKETT